jgi:hypothetical protein
MKRTCSFVTVAITALLALPAAAQRPTAAPLPAQLGFSPERLARIDSFMRQAVDSNRIAGAVVLVMRDGRVAYERAFGWADREAGRRMATDAIFRIASQSKAITSAALLSRERVHVLVRALNMHALFANDTLHVDACSVQRATKPGAEGFVRGEPYLQDRMSGLCRDASVPPTCARIICVDSIIVATKGITRVHLTVNRGSVQYREEHEFIRAYGGFDWVRVVLRQPIVND